MKKSILMKFLVLAVCAAMLLSLFACDNDVEPTEQPTEQKTEAPTKAPEPSVEPTDEPSVAPTVEPTDEPTVEPEIPTNESEVPTVEPEIPTNESEVPTVEPEVPTEPEQPTEAPEQPTEAPEAPTGGMKDPEDPTEEQPTQAPEVPTNPEQPTQAPEVPTEEKPTQAPEVPTEEKPTEPPTPSCDGNHNFVDKGSQGHYCDKCGKPSKDNMYDHTYGDVDGVYKCTACGYEPDCKGEHAYVSDDTHHWTEKCPVCEAPATEAEAHTGATIDGEYKCTVCGKVLPCPAEHVWVSDAEGHQMAACDVCGAAATDKVPHSEEKVEFLTDTAYGYECKDCGYDLYTKALTDKVAAIITPGNMHNAEMSAEKGNLSSSTKYHISTSLDMTAMPYASITHSATDNISQFIWNRHLGDVADRSKHEEYTFSVGQAKYLVIKARATMAETSQIVINLSTAGSDKYNGVIMPLVKAAENAEWVTYVIDLEKAYGDRYALAEGAEDYVVDTFYFNMHPFTTTDVLDVAYMAFVEGGWSDIGALVDEETVVCVTGNNLGTEVNADTGVCVGAHNYTVEIVDGVYKSVCACGATKDSYGVKAEGPNLFWGAENLYGYVSTIGTADKEVLYDEDGTGYIRFDNTAVNKDNWSAFQLSNGAAGATGQYMVMKFRIGENGLGQTSLSMYINSKASQAAGNNWTTGAVTIKVSEDGQWHYAVIDLANRVKAGGFNANADDGTYAVNFVQIRYFTGYQTTAQADDYMDISYITFCDSMDDIKNIVDAETYEWSVDSGTNALRNTADHTCAQHAYKLTVVDGVYQSVCACGDVAYNYNVKAEAANKFFGAEIIAGKGGFDGTMDLTLTYDETDAFVRIDNMVVNADKWAGFTPVTWESGNFGQYMIMKFRIGENGLGQSFLQIYTHSVASKDAGINWPTGNLKFRVVEDNQWHYIVIDMAASVPGNAWQADANGNYAPNYFQFRPFASNQTGAQADDYMDISYIAFCDSLDDIKDIVDAETYEWCVDSSTNALRNTADGSLLGTKAEDPIDVMFDEYGSATVTVPAKTTMYYSTWMLSGEMSLSANGEPLEFVAGMPRMTPSTFSITNDGEEAMEYYLYAEYPVGHMNNPDSLWAGEDNVVEIPAGCQGYFYTYEAYATGTLTLKFSATTGWSYVVNNLTAGTYGNTQYSDSDPVVDTVVLDVVAGDVYQIIVNTYDPENPWEAPAGTVTVSANLEIPYGSEFNPVVLEGEETVVTVPAGATYYVSTRASGATLFVNGEDKGVITAPNPWTPYTFTVTNETEADAEYTFVVVFPEGTMDNPKDLVLGDNSAEFAEGAEPYYFTWTAEKDGTLTLTISATTGWFYVVNNMTSYVYGDMQWSDSDPVVNPAVVEVKAGDVLEIQVNTYDPENMWSNPAGTVTVAAAFEEAITVVEDLSEINDMEDGTKIQVSGTVTVIDTPWDDYYGNITVTIEDEFGNTFQLFRLKTNVVKGDIITATGVLGSYNGAKQLNAGGTATIDGHDTSYDVGPVEVTIAEALELADGTDIIVTGTVTEVNYAWSDSYGNMSVTITDDNGDELYIYKLATKVYLGDTITVTGAMATYNSSRQVGAGATADVVTPHECNYSEPTCLTAGKCTACGAEGEAALGHSDADPADGVCDVCGADLEAAASQVTTTLTLDAASRTSFDATTSAVWETEGVKFTNNKGSYNNNLGDYTAPARIYAGTEVVIECTGMVKIVFNVNSGKTVDGLVNGLTDTAAYTVDVDGYTVTVTFAEPADSITFSATAQFRLDSMDVTYAA